MVGFFELLRTRLLPAILTAAGVALVTAGLLTYTAPVEALPDASAQPTIIALPSESPSPAPSVSTSPSPSPSASASATIPPDRVATRVKIPALRIDLPVIKQPNPSYPSCNVAMYHDAFGPPGDPQGTYIYAHGRTGMFLPILTASKINNGASMLSMIVEVYTSDDQLFLYEVDQVRRHLPANTNLTIFRTGTAAYLWLQTSEGPNHTYPKLLLRARPVASGPADHVEAHPKAHPITC